MGVCVRTDFGRGRVAVGRCGRRYRVVEDDKLSGCSVGGGPSGASLDGCNGLVCM